MSEVLCLGVSFKTAPVALRERLAMSDTRARTFLTEVTAHETITEAAIISTCNRTELYVVSANPVAAESAVLGMLAENAQIRPTELTEVLYAPRNCDAARHLYRVVGGLDSMIVGEMEVQGQVRRAHELARDAGTVGPMLHMELELLNQAGIKPVDLIKIATLNSAIYLGREKDMGSVEQGKIADLVLLDADPAAGVKNFRAVNTVIKSGKKIAADTVMYSAGRQGQTDHLDLPAAGLEADARGRIFVDDDYQTKVDHIYAVGDVIGFPALAATSMDQGRLAAYHAFGEPAKGMTDLQPIGIYSIPEVSYVGATEVELTKKCLPYEVGVSRYRELARGQIAGDSYGMLKLLVSTDDLKLLGVHIFGTSATEMVHIGQAVLNLKGTIDYFIQNTFNYPTLAEAYKIAGLDAWNRMTAK